MDKLLLKAIEEGNTKKFYLSTCWKKKRKDILKRDNNECQRCKGEGRFSRAETVHHIKHLKVRPDLALVDSNLISLCNTCHNLEHPEKLEKFIEKSEKRRITEEKW